MKHLNLFAAAALFLALLTGCGAFGTVASSAAPSVPDSASNAASSAVSSQAASSAPAGTMTAGTRDSVAYY